jgi:hypothetical protein
MCCAPAKELRKNGTEIVNESKRSNNCKEVQWKTKKREKAANMGAKGEARHTQKCSPIFIQIYNMNCYFLKSKIHSHKGIFSIVIDSFG